MDIPEFLVDYYDDYSSFITPSFIMFILNLAVLILLLLQYMNSSGWVGGVGRGVSD